MEKRGLTENLRQAGCTNAAGLFWGDEMRVGSIGTIRRVWAPRGVEVEQAVEFEYEWAYSNLAVNGITALNSALASCAPGLVVVNVDNGYGAGCAALRMLNVTRNNGEW